MTAHNATHGRIFEKELERENGRRMFRVPSLHGLPETVSEVQWRRRDARFFLQSFLRKFSKIFGKNIDGVGKRVLLRPSQDGAPAKAEDVTDQGGEIRFLRQV